MSIDICYQDIYYKFSQVYSNPISEFLLNAQSFQQIYNMLISSEFVHIIPVIIFMTAVVVFLCEHDKLFELSWLFGARTLLSTVYKSIMNWFCFTVCLSVWLTFQRTLYCITWLKLSKVDNNKAAVASTPWWYRPYYMEDKDYIIQLVYPNPHVISWFMCCFLAVIVNHLVWPASWHTILGDYILWLQKLISQSTASKYLARRAQSNEVLYPYEEEQNHSESPQSSKHRKVRPNKPYSIPSYSENNLMFQ